MFHLNHHLVDSYQIFKTHTDLIIACGRNTRNSNVQHHRDVPSLRRRFLAKKPSGHLFYTQAFFILPISSCRIFCESVLFSQVVHWINLPLSKLVSFHVEGEVTLENLGWPYHLNSSKPRNGLCAHAVDVEA